MEFGTGDSIESMIIDRITQGWNDESTDQHFQKQRQTSDNPTFELTGIWFQRMKGLLWEIDTNLKCVPGEVSIDFLDLG